MIRFCHSHFQRSHQESHSCLRWWAPDLEWGRAARDATAVTVYGDDYETADGTCIRDYIHVADIADAHVLHGAK